MANVTTILSRLVSALTVSDPTWDVSVGSATYKILESIANEIAIASNNSTLQTYSFNVNSKSGSDLDAFVNIFGISRRLGTRAVGTVTFSIPSTATTNIQIPGGTQVFVNSTISAIGTSIYFATQVGSVINIGETEVEVPIVATLPGSFGNVAAQTITQVLTPLVGTPLVINYQAITGGTDTETDSQLQTRFANTAFSNVSGIVDKFVAMALQDPNVTQVNVVGAQQTYTEQDQVITTLSGNSNFHLGLNFQAQLTATSGSTTASLSTGSFPVNITVPSGSITVTPSGLYSGTIYNNGTSYNLSSTTSGNITLVVNYTVSGSNTTLSGSSTASGVQTVVSGLVFSTPSITSTSVLTSGSTVSGTGVTVVFSQPTGWNLIVTSGTVSGTNSITSQIPDSKYTYPEGGELLGLNIGSINQTLLTNIQDYNYPTNPTVPLTITLNPNPSNAGLTYTGCFLQLQSEYIPQSSRITSPTTNSNYVDIFINPTTATSITEQVLVQPTVVFTSGVASGVLNSNNFAFANGTNCISGSLGNVGDYYIPFSNNPVTTFPAQLVSGNAPSFVTFTSVSGNINIPICLEYVNSGGTISGLPPTIVNVSGGVGNNYLTTTTSISGLYLGLVASGTGIGATGGYSTLSGIPFGSYITQLVPGSPNYIYLNNTLTSNVNVASTSGITFVTVGYAVYDITNNAGSILDKSGIALDSVDQAGYATLGIAPYTTPSGVLSMAGVITHNYNSDVTQVNDLIQQSRVVGTNVLVRQAQYLNLIINLSVIYNQNANIPLVNNNIQSALTQYLQNVPYSGVVSLSNIANTALGVASVASCRVSTFSDNASNYGILTVPLDGNLAYATRYTADILLANNQLATLNSIYTTSFGFNNF